MSAVPAEPCRIVLYSHDTMGIGHMRRNLLIAEALSASPLRPTVLLVAGAREAALFDLPPRVDLLTLPSLSKSTDGTYGPRSLATPLRDLVDLRAQTLRGAIEAFAPDLLIADKVPCGALGELRPALHALRALRQQGRTRCVLGLRDVLDDPQTVAREWADEGSIDSIRDDYDAVWVYGSPAVYDLAREYQLPDDVAAKLQYVGYLNRFARRADGTDFVNAVNQGNGSDPPAGAGEELGALPGRLALCMVGGGQDGAALAASFARAPIPEGMTGLVVTGPFMPPDARRHLRELSVASRGRVRVLEFASRPDLLIRRADRVVSMGGYNTVCEVIAGARNALVVPRVRPRREQYIRAANLQRLGLLDVLHPDDATPDALGAWLARDLPPPAALPAEVSFDALNRLTALAAELLASRGPDARLPTEGAARSANAWTATGAAPYVA